MYEHNLLNHHEYDKIDKSNFWTDGGPVLDVPVFPPDTLSFDGIGEVSPYDYKGVSIGLFNTDTAYFLLGHDLYSRYVFLKVSHNSCQFLYRYGGKGFPQSRTFSGYAAHDKTIYVTGGLMDGRPLNDVWGFNIDKEQWNHICNLPSTRWEHNTTVDDEGIWVFGGRNKSDIDNMELRLNDLWYYNLEEEIWHQYDKDALLPHGEAAILGVEGDWVFIYFVKTKELWKTSHAGGRETELVGVMSLPTAMDVKIWNDNFDTYLAFSSREDEKRGFFDGHTKGLYRWDGGETFTSIPITTQDEADKKSPFTVACLGYDENGDYKMIRNTRTEGIRLENTDTLKLRPTEPPATYISKCETPEGEFYLTLDEMAHWDFNTFHCDYFYDIRPIPGSVVCYDETHDWIWLYTPNGHLYIVDYETFEMTEIQPTDEVDTAGEIPKRISPLLASFKNKIWFVGGLENNSQTDYFDTLDLASLMMKRVNMLDKPPSHRRHMFVYNQRLWILTRNVDHVWCFYDNYQIWKKLNFRDPTTLELPYNEGVVSLRENHLIVSGINSETLRISLDSRRVSSLPGLSAPHVAAVNKSYLLVSEGLSGTSDDPKAKPLSLSHWIYIYDVSTMDPATHDAPPHYLNTNIDSYVEGKGIIFPIFTRSHMTSAIDEMGQRNCLYKDNQGVFWIDQKSGRYYDFDEEEGFYNPNKDHGYGGDAPESLVRWMPSYRHLIRDPFNGEVALDFEYNDEHFILESGLLHRMRFSDGYRFSHNVPMWNGCAAGINSNGELFVFGGAEEGSVGGEAVLGSAGIEETTILTSDERGKYFPHGEIYDSDGFEFEHFPPNQPDVVLIYKTHNGFHLYDVNYIAAQTEYLDDIPDFYERLDYDLARDYLVDMKKKLMAEEDDGFNEEKAGSIQERVYTETQAIVDDLAVRYVTNETGRRPYARTYPLYGQIGDDLYIGGGCTIIDVFPPMGTPFRLFNFNDVAGSSKPEEEQSDAELEFSPSDWSNRGMYKFNMLTRTWTWVSKLPMGEEIDESQGGVCYLATMVLRPNTTDFYVVGGCTEDNVTGTINDIWIFHTATSKWEQIEYVPDSFLPRHSASCVWLDDDRLLISYGYITTTGASPYKTYARGDQWILHAEEKIMYKVGQDLTKKFVVVPGERDEDVLKLLLWGEDEPGAKGDLKTCLTEMHKDTNWVVLERLCAEAISELTALIIDARDLPSTGGANLVNSTYLTGLFLGQYEWIMQCYQNYQEELIGEEFFDATRILRGDFEGLHTDFITWVVDHDKKFYFELAIDKHLDNPGTPKFFEDIRNWEAQDIYEATSWRWRRSLSYYYTIAPFSNYLKTLPYTEAELKSIENGAVPGTNMREQANRYPDFLESKRIYEMFKISGAKEYYENTYKMEYHEAREVVELSELDRYYFREFVRRLNETKNIPATFLTDFYWSEMKRKQQFEEDLKEYHEQYDKLIRDWEYAEQYARRFSWGKPSKYWRYAFLKRGYKKIPARPPEEPTFGDMDWKDTLSLMKIYANIMDTELDESHLFMVDVSLVTGRPSKVNAIYMNEQITMEPESLIDLFQYKDGSWWFSAYTNNDFGFWRLFTRETDSDYDMDFLAIDQPSSVRPLATAYNNNDKVLVVYNYQNIYELDIRTAMYNPNADYWHFKAPALNMREALNDEMKCTYFDGNYVFFTKEGRILAHNPESMLWKHWREDAFEDVNNVVIDGKELYYLGNYESSRYFDLSVMQGDRFMIDSSRCEHDDKNIVLPKISVQRNMVYGFDINNNLVYAWTRKHGQFDVSYRFERYFKIKEILLSVDQNSLQVPAVAYAETATGSRAFHSTEPRMEHLWSFDNITRRYYYESLYTVLPDQYIVIPIDDEVSNVEIVFKPPASGSSYIARLNGVLFVAEDTEKILPTELKLSCPDTNVIGLRSYRRDTSRWTLSSDNRHIQLAKGEIPFDDKLEVSIPPGGYITVDVRCLKLGEIANVLAIDMED